MVFDATVKNVKTEINNCYNNFSCLLQEESSRMLLMSKDLGRKL